MKKKYIKIILFVLSLIIFDQIIKYIVVNNMTINSSITIISNFLSIKYVTNNGAAFGIFSSNNPFILIIISIVLIYYLIKELKNNIQNNMHVTSLCLIISGALGNIIDRCSLGYVVDYVSFTLFKRDMAIFNFADMCITFGVILLLIILIKESKCKK